MRKTLLSLLLLILLVVPTAAQEAGSSDAATPDALCEAALPAPEPETREYTEPGQVLEDGVDYQAIFCTESGAIYVDLFEEYTPVTVNNFVFLATNGYYNNITFHRVLADFMAQGGDPTGTGSGGPGYQFEDEFVSFLRFDRPGQLAMANAGANTNGSQFFLTTVPTSHLDFAHTIFGEVLAGQDVVENLPLRDPETADEPGPSLNTVLIITDPETVSAEVQEPEKATQEDFETWLEVFPEDIGLPNVMLSSAETAVVATDDLPAAIGEVFADKSHLFTAEATYRNTECDFSEVAVESLSYKVHVFDTAEDAAQVMASDAFLAAMTEDREVEETAGVLTGLPIYFWQETACDVTSTHGLMVRQLGRIITVAESVYAADSPVQAESWFDQISVQLFEVVFYDALRQEASR